MTDADTFRAALAVALDCELSDAAIIEALAVRDDAARMRALVIASELIASLNDEPLPTKET